MSETFNDGGPAFPHGPMGGSFTGPDGYTSHQHPGSAGMSLRDWFAGKALLGSMGFGQDDLLDVACGNADLVAEMLAKAPYKIADAMLAERDAIHAEWSEADEGLTSDAVAVRDEIKRLADEWCVHSSNGLDVMASSCLDAIEAKLAAVRP